MNLLFNLFPVLWRRSLRSHPLIFLLLQLPFHLLLHLHTLLKLSYLEEISSPSLCHQSNRWMLKLLCLINPFWPQLPDPRVTVVVPVPVDASNNDKAVDSKSKKKAHKPRRDKSSDKTGKSDSKVSSAERSLEKTSVSDAIQKKCDRSRSPVSKSSRKPEHSTPPPAGPCQLRSRVCQATGHYERG